MTECIFRFNCLGPGRIRFLSDIMTKSSKLREVSEMKVLISIICLLLISCAGKKESLPVSSDGIEISYQEFGEATLYFYNKDNVQWKLEAQTMRKPILDTGSIMVVPVRLTLYDSLGSVSTRVLSDSGTISGSMGSYIVWGDVFIRTSDSLVIRTEKLWWYKDRQKVESDTFVQIETVKGDILRGKGLDATEDFSRFSFKSNVSGKFPDFKKRMESNDEQIF